MQKKYIANYGGYTQAVLFFKYRQCIIIAPVIQRNFLYISFTFYGFISQKILYFTVLFLISFAFYGFISYVFHLCFTVLLKQLRRLYTGGFIFQVPPVSDYSTCCINAYLRVSTPSTCLRVRCTNYLLTRLVHP